MNALLGPVFLENTGDGTLTERVLVPGASSFRQRLEVADMNGDGRLDIVGYDGNFDVVFVPQGPLGTFLPPTLVATLGERVHRVMVADVNDDSTPDLAVVVSSPDGSVPTPRDLVWFEGVGGGAFQSAELLFSGLEDALGPVPYDFDGMGTIDFVWMSRSTRFSIVAFRGAMGPYFIRDLGFDPGGPSARFAIGDLLGNGRRDLVVAGGPDENDPSQNVRIYSRNGTGLSWIEQSTLEGLQDVRSIRIVDVDGDHDDDILIAADRSPHLSWIENLQSDDVGVNYCGPAATNSAGGSARISAVGSDIVTLNQLALRADDLPADATGFFLVGQAQGFFPNAGGSSGTLCLGGAIGRYVGAGQVQTATSDGAMQLEVSLVAIPQPTGIVSAQAGTLWFFQAWYRDTVASQPTSNFTDGLAIVFR